VLSAALSVAGLHAYATITEITNRPPGLGVDKAEILAGGMRNILLDAGTLFGLAGIVYLLAPPADDETDEPQTVNLSQEA
jgi:hypothetical protein